MSLFGAEFLRNVKEYLDDDCCINFTPNGYLVLASESGAEILEQNSKLQNELGAKNELLTAARLKERFPWINTDGVALGRNSELHFGSNKRTHGYVFRMSWIRKRRMV